jgi:hypothetical protein
MHYVRQPLRIEFFFFFVSISFRRIATLCEHIGDDTIALVAVPKRPEYVLLLVRGDSDRVGDDHRGVLLGDQLDVLVGNADLLLEAE